jgi:hypothetical protein
MRHEIIIEYAEKYLALTRCFEPFFAEAMGDGCNHLHRSSRTTSNQSGQSAILRRCTSRRQERRTHLARHRCKSRKCECVSDGYQASPEIPRNIAIVMDGGHQANVLSKEKDLAIALINELAGAGTNFTVVRAGASPETRTTTLDRSVAIQHLRDITTDTGEKTSVPIYDSIGSAIREISPAPGLRVVIFIGEGNDGGSRLRYADLRNLAESNQIAFCAALIADHTLRGTKSILRYGWNLRDLTGETTGVFLENPKTPKATRKLIESAREFRLVVFDSPSALSGRYRISVLTRRGKRLRAQKAIVVP